MTVLAIEGALLSLTALFMLAFFLVELSHPGPCSTFNVNPPCEVDRFPRDPLLVAGALTGALALVWAAWRLVQWSRVAWVVAVLAQLTPLAYIARSTDKFGAFAAPFLIMIFVAASGLVGLCLCSTCTFGSRSTVSKPH